MVLRLKSVNDIKQSNNDLVDKQRTKAAPGLPYFFADYVF